MTAEIDPEVLRDLNENLIDNVDENGKVINEEKFNDLKQSIEKNQIDKGEAKENIISIDKGSDGTIEMVKGGERVTFDGKSYGKFMADFKTKTVDTFKSVDMTNGPLNDACDSAGKQISQGLIGSNGLATELSESIRINLQPELETQAQKGLKPEQTSTVTGTQVDSLPENVQTAEEAQQNAQNPTVQLLEKVTGLQDKIESWKNEAKKQGVDSKKYIDGKFDEIEKRLKDKLPTETQKSKLSEVIEVLKFLITLTGFGLASYLVIAELNKHANQNSGCFVDFVDSKNKTSKTLYKVRQLTCNSDYKNVKPSSMQWADDNYTLAKDCITGENTLPKPSGCNNCYQSLTTMADCPCADSDNFVSLFCSNNYLANPDSQSSIVHHYHPEKQSRLDAFNDIASYVIEIAKEAANDAAQGFGDLLKNLFKFIEYGAIVIGIVIIIYIILWIFGIVGERGRESERVEIESEYPDTKETLEQKQVAASPPIVQQPIEEKSLDNQDALDLLSKIQKNGIQAAASEAGVITSPSQQAPMSSPPPQQAPMSSPPPRQAPMSSPPPRQAPVSIELSQAPVSSQSTKIVNQQAPVSSSLPARKVAQSPVVGKKNDNKNLFPDDAEELRKLSPSTINTLTSGLDQTKLNFSQDTKIGVSGPSVFQGSIKSKKSQQQSQQSQQQSQQQPQQQSQQQSQQRSPGRKVSTSSLSDSDASSLVSDDTWEEDDVVKHFRPKRKSIRVSRRLIK